MAKRPKDKTDSDQSKRFIEKARELGADESEKGQEQAFGKVGLSGDRSMPARIEKFTYGGAEYEVRATRIDDEWKVAVFDSASNKVSDESSISNENVDDMKVTGASADPVKDMMDQVQEQFTA